MLFSNQQSDVHWLPWYTKAQQIEQVKDTDSPR